MDDRDFWMAALAIAAPLSFYSGFRSWRLARLIEDTPVSRIRSAARNARWQTINRGVSVAPFLLQDETGACLVGPTGADVRPGASSCWRGSLPWPTAPGEGRRFFGLESGDYRYTEHRINECDRVSVIGEFRTSGGAAAADPGSAMQQLLDEWKRDQAALLARFDTDRDGALSQAEWERARAAARAQLEQLALSGAGPAASIVVRPVDGRPFLIAAGEFHALELRARLLAAGPLAAFLVATAVLATLLFRPR